MCSTQLYWLVAYHNGIQVFATIFQCHPVDGFWEVDSQGTCHRYEVLLGASIPHIITDVAMLLVPITLVWRTPHMGRSQKVMLSGIFALGGLYVCPSTSLTPTSQGVHHCSATVISIIRLVSLIRLSAFSSDPTADLVNALIWTNVEVNVAIVSGMSTYHTFAYRNHS